MEFKIYQDRQKIKDTGNINNDYRILFPQTVAEAVIYKNDFTDENTLNSVIDYIVENNSYVITSEDEPTISAGDIHWMKIIGTYHNGTIGNIYLTYILNHVLRNHDGNDVIAETEEMTIKADTEVVPETKTYDGYACETPSKVKICENGQIIECCYNELQYTITYVLYSGTNVASNPDKIYYTENVTLADATKAYTTFNGWYLDSEFSSKIEKLSKVCKDITLYAKFTDIEYGITYVLNGGTNVNSNPTIITYYETITLANASKNYCTFDGWYTDSAFTNKVETLSNINSDITLYAKFIEISYTINYILDGGTNSPSNPTTITYYETVTLANPNKNYCTFEGWYTDSTFKNKVTSLSNINSDITLYAKFTNIEYGITYVLNGGTNNLSNPSTITYYDSVTLANATKAYCTFDGWYSDAGFTNKITSLSNTNVDITLYAKFTEIPYTVTYVLNGGTNSLSNPSTITYYSSVTLSNATKSGHTFDGWYLDSGFSKKVTSLSNISTDITLYAKFTEVSYTITYVLNGGTNSSSNPTTIKYTDNITLANATKGNDTFEGWYLDSEFTNRITTLSNINSDITLYAKFKAELYTGLITNVDPRNMDSDLYVGFTPPSDAAYVVLVYNNDHIPINETDGISKEKYISGTQANYLIANVEPYKQYYYALFACNSKRVYNYDDANTFTFTTSAIYPVVPELKVEVIDNLIVRCSYTVPTINPKINYPNAVDGFADPRIPGDFYLTINKDKVAELPANSNVGTIESTGRTLLYGFPTYGYSKQNNSDSTKYYSGDTVVWDIDFGLNKYEEGTYYVQLFTQNTRIEYGGRVNSLESNIVELDMNWSNTIKDYAIGGATTWVLDGEGQLYACGANKGSGYGLSSSKITSSNELIKVEHYTYEYSDGTNNSDSYMQRFNFIDGYADYGGVVIAGSHYNYNADSYGIKPNTMYGWGAWEYSWHTDGALNKFSTLRENAKENMTIIKSAKIHRGNGNPELSIITEDNKLITGGLAGLLGYANNFSNWYSDGGVTTDPSKYIANTIASDCISNIRYRIDTSNNLYQWKASTSGNWEKLKSGISKIDCGYNHVLILDTSGNLYVAGVNYYDYDYDDSGNYTYYASGALGIFTNATLNSSGKYVINDTTNELSTYSSTLKTYDFIQLMSGTKFIDIACGDWHSLALDSNGNIWSFGLNDKGQLGDGTTKTKLTPVKISSGVKFISVKAKIDNSSARDTNGNVWIWGNNEYGQLGNGTTVNSNVPIKLQIKKS